MKEENITANLPVSSLANRKEALAENISSSCIFMTEGEKKQVQEAIMQNHVLVSRFWVALQNRVATRVANPGLLGLHGDTQWWYPAAEYLSDAAMVYALAPEEKLGCWLREVTLGIVRRPEADWVGPWFRDHSQPYTGHLETAHLCWAVAAVYDLAREVFTAAEQEEIAIALHQKGIVLCQRWLQQNTHLANWRGIMTSGILVAAAAIERRDILEEYLAEAILCADAFQPDGSYAESLQYGNYLAFALMMAYEATCRKYPDIASQLSIAAYAKGMPWVASSMLYSKPMTGWGEQPRARAANFNDSAALFRPSGDLLLHIAARCKEAMPQEAGLAQWLFDTYYAPVPTQKPNHLATFGFHNDWGFLTLPLLLQSPKSISPEEANLPKTVIFSNGHAFIRDSWNGKTIVAIQGGSKALYGPGHLHGDLNSFILAHNKERLLVDPGHSCYRNLIHGLESATQTHNTCTFLVEQEGLGLQEDLAKIKLLEQQSLAGRRKISNGKAGAPVSRGNKQLLIAHSGEVSVVGAEAAGLYGKPIKEFSRFWIQAGSHVLFVIDRIKSSQPVTTIWNWLLNNRDGETQVFTPQPNQIALYRGSAGLKIFHGGDAKMSGPVYGYVHDAYHPEPNQVGEGKPGSGLLYRFTEKQPDTSRIMIHAFAFDAYGAINKWAFSSQSTTCQLSNGNETWQIEIGNGSALQIEIINRHQKKWQLQEVEKEFTFIS
ncbi:heparinase II/III family protein [Rhodocytophaga aerolata]|uniref:Heparinase II/III family protein n=1 Tax=Rhodocytophaga aerolata TaxID=455078 RepID=A0ABT8RC42_9BACT|nr:heparinase II/III family protein [Rhodocytophaga aerolata]MDO1449673.1 heparinase II/III family protein [Rhodocytophaga aerolata]